MSALATDLQGLAMAAAYHAAGRRELATYELFVRALPRGRSFLVAAGIEVALERIETLRFTTAETRYLREDPYFQGIPASFFQWLEGFRFTGTVRAVAEGTPVFAGEPLLSVTAPVVEAQILETALLAVVSLSTSAASKAARLVTAARDRPVVEFAGRRAPGIAAPLWIAHAAYLAGCAGTSNVEAARLFGIPLFGGAAHSWVLAHGDERQAFEAFLDLFPDADLLPLDTYDAEAAARTLAGLGRPVRGVRIDSGELGSLSRSVREILDGAGLRSTTITASGELDEYRIDELVCGGAPIDRFGVGKQLATPGDAPALGAVYKLVEIEGERGAVRKPAKTSPGKANVAGAKQVLRRFDEHGRAAGDRVATLGTPPRKGETELLAPAIVNGQRARPTEPLELARARTRAAIEALPPGVRRLAVPDPYPIAIELSA